MEWIIDSINILSVLYVALPLMFLLAIVFYYLAGRSLSKENWDRILDFGKWYLVSVALVISAKMIENGFHERETGLKEMDGFDKYVSIITDTKGIDKRWELCKYFSTVTPTKRLRDGWLIYKESIKADYENYLKLQNKEDSILKKDTITNDDKKELNIINLEKAKYETSISGNTEGTHVIIFTSDKNLDQAKYELNKIAKIIESPRLVLRDGFYVVVSKNYRSRAEAQGDLNNIKNRFTSNPYVSNMDRWCPNPVFNGTYFECK
jgi:hypothetical protein